MRLRYLTPQAERQPDPIFAAAVAHASTIAETRDPLAAMRAAFAAAGVDLLDDRHDVLLGELDQMKARLEAAEKAARRPAPFDLAAAIDSALRRPVQRPEWAGPQRPPAGRRSA